ncbi:hypothetical protein KCU65_g5749, partial [Aureobasidium melanogenum]
MATSHFGPYRSIRHYLYRLVYEEANRFSYGDLLDWSWEEEEEDEGLRSLLAERRSDERQYRAAAAYKTLLPHLMLDKEPLLRSALWNPNLRTDAIFFDPDNPTNMKGLIDWRGTELVSVYKHTQQPPLHNPCRPSKYKSGHTKLFQKSIFELCAERDRDGTYKSSNPVIAASLKYRNSVESWLLENTESRWEDEWERYMDRADEYVQANSELFAPGTTIDNLIEESYRPEHPMLKYTDEGH